MNSLEPAPHGSPGRDGTTSDDSWFLSSTPTSPPNAAGSGTPLGKRDPLAAPLEPLASFDLPATQRLASSRTHADSESQSTSSQAGREGERPCTPSPSRRTSAQTEALVMTAEREEAAAEARMSLSPVQGDEVRTAEDKTRGATPPPFEFDPFEEETGRANGDEEVEGFEVPLAPPTPPQGPFSTTLPIQRSFRSRYASSSTDSLPLDEDIVLTQSHTSPHAPALAHKRSHSHVAPSTGYTPPASYDESEDVGMYSPPSMPLDAGLSAIDPQFERDEGSERPGARWRRSFSYEAQRAAPTTSTSTISATVHAPSTGTSTSTQHAPPYVGLLRRRARQPSSSDQGERIAATAPPSQTERGHSKRRRSGSFFTSATTPIEPSLDLRPANTPSWASMTLPRQAASPVISAPTTDDDVRTIRRRTRLSFGRLRPSEEQERAPSASGNGAVAAPSALSSPAVAAAQDRLLDSTLANRRALARQSSLLEAHAHRTNALSLRGEDLLREAAGVLRRAEDSVSRASNLVQTQAWESRLPSVGALPEPSDPNTQRPVVGIRLGQGWSAETRPASTAATTEPAPMSPTTRRRRTVSFLSMSAASSAPLGSLPPAMSSHERDDAESSSAASTSAASIRARQFLTSLRARRPRLSRNATAVSPPEGEEQALSPDRDSASYLRSWTLPSPPLANSLVISTFDEEAEVLAAAQLNAHLLDRRQVHDTLDAGLSPPTPPLSSRSLWGEPRANNPQQEFLTSRRMRGPTERANERWRRGEPPVSNLASDASDLAPSQQQRAFPTWHTQRTETPQTAIPNRRPILGSPPRFADTADTREADAFMRTRDESPSPRSRRSVRRAASELFSSRSLNAAEEGTSSSAASTLLDQTERASIRLPLSSRPPAVSRTDSRVRFEDAEEAPPQGRGWSGPATGPLMLSSGSDGRRMIFPHPAHAAGPSVATVGAAAHDLHLDDVETRRFFEEDDLHPPPFTFDRLARRGPEDRVPAPRLPPRRHPWESDYVAAEAGNFEARPPPQFSDDAARPHFRTISEETLQQESARRAARSAGLSNLSIEARRQSSHASVDAGMRQRRTVVAGRTDLNESVMHAQRADETNDDEAGALLEDRLAQHRQHRVQRLHALRQERNLMRSLLSGTSGEDGPSSSRAFGAPENSSDPTRLGGSNTLRRDGTGPAADPSRSPGAIWRRRGLGEFLRGFGAGGGRGLISMFDEDFPSFWGRDSAALDPRNYLDDDEFDSSYEALIRLSERLGDARPKGVSLEKLASLSKFQYSVWPMPQRASRTPSSSLESAPMASTSSVPLEQDTPTLARKGLEKEERCGICLCDYSDDDECMLGHCGHGFHAECLTSWLKEKGTCPVCRSDHTKS